MAPPDPTRRGGPGPLASVLLIALLCLIWGSTWIVIKKGLQDLPPFSSAGIRFAIAWLVFACLAPVLARSEGGGRPPWSLRLAHGLLQLGLSYGIVYWTETRLPSGLVSLLWSVFPLMMAIAGHLFLEHEQLRTRQWLGFLLGFAGVATLFATDLRRIGPEAVPTGLVLLISPLVVVIATTMVKRHAGRVSSVLLNRDGMGIGAISLLSVGLLTESGESFQWTARAWGSIVYLALFGSVLAFGLYFWLLRYVPTYRLSVIAYVTPAVALSLGAWIDGERVGLQTIGGGALILAGVGLAAARRQAIPRRSVHPVPE